MSLSDVFGVQKKPMPTVQLQINRRPHVSSKFYSASKRKTGRKPSDIRPRFVEPIPPDNADYARKKRKAARGIYNASMMTTK